MNRGGEVEEFDKKLREFEEFGEGDWSGCGEGERGVFEL